MESSALYSSSHFALCASPSVHVVQSRWRGRSPKAKKVSYFSCENKDFEGHQIARLFTLQAYFLDKKAR